MAIRSTSTYRVNGQPVATTTPALSSKAESGFTMNQRLNSMGTNIGTSSTPSAVAPTLATPKTDANTLLAQYNQSGNLSIDQMLGKTAETPVIAGDTLTKTETPLVVEKPKEGTASSELNQTIATSGTYIDPAAQRMRDESNSELKNILTQLTEQPGDEVRIQEREGVFTKQQTLTDIENRIASVNRDYEKQARVIRKNQEGKFGGAVEQDLRNLQRQSDEQNADLSIIKSAANNDLQTALKISETKINAKYEPLKLQLEALKTFREFNQDNLTESEKARLNQVISQENAKFEAGVAKETSDQETKTELLALASSQGASSAELLAIQNGTVEEAIAASGKYLAAKNNEIVEIGDSKFLINKVTGEVVKSLGGGDGGGGTTYSTPSTSALAGLKNLVGNFSSVAAQKLFSKSVDELAVKGNDKGIAEKIIGTVFSNLPADDQKRVGGGFKVAQELTRIKGLLDEYTALNGDTGLFSGSKQKIAQKLGQVNDPQLASIGTQILNTLDNLVRARTGAALTESEEAFYRKILPDIDKVGSLNNALIDGLRTSIMADVEQTLNYQITSDGVAILKSVLPEVFADSAITNSYLDNTLNQVGDGVGDSINNYLNSLNNP